MGRHQKRERQLATQAEHRRRQEERARRCPLTRIEFEEMFAFVARRSFHEGVKKTFAYTESWLDSQSKPRAETLTFLRQTDARSDWDVLVSVDPHLIFGPTPTRSARMPLEPDEFDDLVDWIDARVQSEGCNHDLRFTEQWLTAHQLPLETTIFALIAQGGACDCEVVMNIEPESIYPETLRSNSERD